MMMKLVYTLLRGLINLCVWFPLSPSAAGYRTAHARAEAKTNKSNKKMSVCWSRYFGSNPNCWNARDVGYRVGRCLYNQAS